MRPFWLRRLEAVRRECAGQSHGTATERFQAACALMAWTVDALERQAREQHCSVTTLLARCDRAERRFRSRDR